MDTKDAGRMGGNARAKKLSKKRLSEIARKAGLASQKAKRKKKTEKTA